MASMWLIKSLGVTMVVFMFLGQCLCDNHTYYYRVSAVITNWNFTEELADPNSTERTKMTSEIFNGLVKMYKFPSSKYKEYKGELKNISMKLMYLSPSELQFRNASLINKENANLIIKELKTFHKTTIGVFFMTLIGLEFNVTKPSGSLEYVDKIGDLLDGLIIQYFRLVKPSHMLTPNLHVDVDTILIEEVDLNTILRLEDILKYKFNFVSTIVHQTVVSEQDRDILSIISYVGCGFSLVGLTISILTIIISRKMRRLRANQILLQMCLSLLGALLLYSFGIRQLKDESMIETCKALAALLHYFILASMTWASIEAYNLYQDLVKVFDTSTLSHNEFMVRASLVGWVPPGIIVGATVLASKYSYGFHVPDTKNTLCWLHVHAFYGALLAPVLLLVVANMIIFVIVMREIFKMPQAHEKHSKLSQFRATISVFTLLGLNWLFAGMAAAAPNMVLQCLFTITCSFQGFLIFVLHGLLKKDFRDAWGQLSAKNRVMEMLRSSNSQSIKTNTSSMSHNSTAPTNSLSFTNPTQVKFDRMSEMDSGIDIQKTEPM